MDKEPLLYDVIHDYIISENFASDTEGANKVMLKLSDELMQEIYERMMTASEKRKDTMLKKKYDDSDMKKNMIAQYGKEEGTKIYFAKIRKEAMKTEETAIESELLIQDWNKDDIKFTEVEAIDIIKPEPLKPTPSNWREDLGEDWQKVNRKDKTDGLSKKAVKAYRRENPGSKLQTAVTTKPSKLKKGSKSAKRRLSFCRRMKGMKKKLTSAKTRRDPDSRINKALRRWNC